MAKERPKFINCLLTETGYGCGHAKSYNDCKRCGFDETEALRRKSIPATMDDDGLRRKHLGKATE